MGPLIVPQENLILGYLYALNITITEVIRLKEYNLTGNMKKKNIIFFQDLFRLSQGSKYFSVSWEKYKACSVTYFGDFPIIKFQ